MALLRFGQAVWPERVALVGDGERLTYRALYQQAQQMSRVLYVDCGMRRDMRVAMVCRGHLVSALLLPALSRLGVHVRLLSTDMGGQLLSATLAEGNFDMAICDDEYLPADLDGGRLSSPAQPLGLTIWTCSALLHEMQLTSGMRPAHLPRVWQGGEIAVMTGGSSGRSKAVGRRPSVTQYLPPFFSLLHEAGLHRYASVLVSLPLYHGFGLASLIMAWALGAKVCLLQRFEPAAVWSMVEREGVEVLPVVPVLLARLWQQPVPDGARRLRCVLSGGDRLDRSCVEETCRRLGPVLFNLFGTSEAGFFMLATPADLAAHADVPIGRPVSGVACALRDVGPDGVGRLWVRSGWATTGLRSRWHDTGDLAWRSPDGCWFHRGRADRMVVCGGENVYPEHVEDVLLSHPAIIAAHVWPIADPEFGQVLSARVEPAAGAELTAEAVRAWLRPRLSRPSIPHVVEIGLIDLLATGKVCTPDSSR